MKFATRTLTALALLSGVAGTALTAQTVRDEAAAPTLNLNLPNTFTTFGKVDPQLRRPTAIVNGDVITGTDVDQRLALVVFANGGKVSEEEKERLRVQVLRNLIDESLQIHEAKVNEIKIEKAEVDQSFARVAQNLKQTPTKFSEYLRTAGSSERSMRRQIEGEIAWSRLVRRKIDPFINISDDEVKAIVDKLIAQKGSTEYRVGEIFLSATPENQAEVLANANRVMQQLRGGGSFTVYARQVSEASTATVGGDLGWVRAGQLPDVLAARVQELKVGQIAGPIEIAGGFSILYLIDQRQILVANPRDATLSLRQIAMTIPANLNDADAKARVDAFGAAIKGMSGCGQAEAVATQFGAEIVDNDNVKIRDLPAALQDLMLGLQIGQSTPPFGTRADGVRVLAVCGRDEPQVADGPSATQIEDTIREARVNRRSQIYLRDLRRDAVIDYR